LLLSVIKDKIHQQHNYKNCQCHRSRPPIDTVSIAQIAKSNQADIIYWKEGAHSPGKYQSENTKTKNNHVCAYFNKGKLRQVGHFMRKSKFGVPEYYPRLISVQPKPNKDYK